MLNMEPLEKGAENSTAGYPTSYRIYHDQYFICEFCLKLSNSRLILTRHCISEYDETLNSKHKWRNVCIFVWQSTRLASVPSKTQENLEDLRSKHNCLHDGWRDITYNLFVV